MWPSPCAVSRQSHCWNIRVAFFSKLLLEINYLLNNFWSSDDFACLICPLYVSEKFGTLAVRYTFSCNIINCSDKTILSWGVKNCLDMCVWSVEHNSPGIIVSIYSIELLRIVCISFITWQCCRLFNFAFCNCHWFTWRVYLAVALHAKVTPRLDVHIYSAPGICRPLCYAAVSTNYLKDLQ